MLMRQLLRTLTITLIILPAFIHAAMAQYDVSGTVKNYKGEPLIGVTIAVKNTNTGTTTDVDGKYTLRVSSSPATLEYSYLGYHTVEKNVTSAAIIDVSMEETSSELEEVIVSGLATSVKRSNSANAVAEINSKELTGIATQSTFEGALQGKFPGVQITQNSGAPGGGINVRMRGLTSINAPAQPLYIIDGVYIDNTSISAGLSTVSKAAAGGNTAFYNQDNPSNRAADLDPGDFESVEILKGASAAAIYGSRAAGGVVIITTKRGKEVSGGPQIAFSQTLGWQQILHPLGIRGWDSTKVGETYGSGEVQNFLDAKASGHFYDYEDELYGNHGLISDSRLSVASGNDKTAFFASGFHRDESGIVPNTGYDKTGLRLNINHQISNMLDISMTSNYIKSSADRGFFGNDNSNTTMSIALAFTPAWAELHPNPDGGYPDNPYNPSNFLQTAALITNNEAVDRFIVGGAVTAKILNSEKQSLKLILQGGLDDYSFRTTAIFPRELQFEKNGNGTNGASIQGTTHSFNDNESATLLHVYYAPKVTFRTQAGLTRESFTRNTIITTATQLIPGQTNVSQAGSVSVYQFRSTQLDLGGFVQEEVNWDDRVIGTLGFRADKSSNDYDPNKLYFYPKASLAVNLAEFDFWTVDAVSLLKPRIAYGQSGNFPVFGSQFTNLGSVIIDNSAGLLLNTQRGNDSIGPERQKELEFGIDIGFLANRITLEATYYKKDVEDMFIIVNPPPSSGFSTQVTNAASLRNKGVELTLGAEVIKKKDFEWNSTINFWLNRSEITRLDVPAFTLGGFGASLGTFYIDTGKSATQIVGIGPDSLRGEGNEYVVYGDFEPDFQMTFYEDLRYKNWDLTFLFHWKQGGEGANLSNLLSDFGGTTHDYDDITLDPAGVTPNGPYRVQQYLGGLSASPFIENTGYVRLREIGLYYTFDSKNLSGSTHGIIKGARVGVAARNPLNWFKYNSYDPEVSNFVNSGLSSGVEVNPFPSAKQFYATIDLNF